MTSETRVNSHAVMVAWPGVQSGESSHQDGSDGTPVLVDLRARADHSMGNTVLG